MFCGDEGAESTNTRGDHSFSKKKETAKATQSSYKCVKFFQMGGARAREPSETTPHNNHRVEGEVTDSDPERWVNQSQQK